VALNYDGIQPVGRSTSIVVTGAERTTLWPLVQDTAKRFGLAIQPDPRPEQGSYYRSDHFSFARAGIPSFSIREGNDFAGKPPGFGEQTFRDFNEKRYHQPTDEYKEDWDFGGLEELAKFGFTLGTSAANTNRMSTWNAGDEFLPAREKSLRK
jgi:Zn-dependent M28 family amino/carboxypeptidase